MAVGACFGGPALNVLLGIGISCTVACLRANGVYPVSDQPNHQLTVSGGFLILSLLVSLTVVPLCKFNMSRIYGMFLCGIYVVYLATAITLEFAIKTNNSD